jgi:predicted P-loop ATPase
MLWRWSTETGGERGKWSKADEKTFEKLVQSGSREKDREKVGRGTILKMAKAAGWRDWRTELRRRVTSRGVQQVVESEENYMVLLNHHPDLRGRLYHDMVIGADVLGPKPSCALFPHGIDIEEDVGYATAAHLQRTSNIAFVSGRMMMHMMLTMARQRRRNRRQEWVRSLTWDGTERIGRLLLDGFGALDSELVRATGETWMKGLVLRVMRPGCNFQLMPILIGDQGTGKSTALASLCPERWWFTDDQIDMKGSKGSYEVLRRAVICEVGELSNMRRAEKEDVKSFVSRASLNYQRSYARQATTVPASWVFMGTTNEEEFLTDETGNRRFVSIRVGCDGRTYDERIAWVRQWRDQLWAEAWTRVQGQTEVVLPQRVWKAAAAANREAMVTGEMHDIVAEYTERLAAEGAEMAMRDIASAAGVRCESRLEEMQLAGALRRAGWRKQVVWRGARTVRRWVLEPEL